MHKGPDTKQYLVQAKAQRAAELAGALRREEAARARRSAQVSIIDGSVYIDIDE